MRFAIKRASDSLGDCNIRKIPTEGAVSIEVTIQDFDYHPDRYIYCDGLIWFIDLDLKGLLKLLKKEGECIISSDVYFALPGIVGDLPHWDVPIKPKNEIDQEEIDKMIGSIVIYDKYVE